VTVAAPARDLLPALRRLLSIAIESWKAERQPVELLVPSPWARPLFEGDLDHRYKGALQFPQPGQEEYFVLPRIPGEDYVAYLTFSWGTEEKDGNEVQVGGFRVYFVHKSILDVHRRAETVFDPTKEREPIRTFIIRFESPNPKTWTYHHAQVSNDKLGALDYARLLPLPQKLVPDGAPHLPLDTCATPAGLLISLVLSLYGNDPRVYQALADIPNLSGQERALLQRFAPAS
jgi:hypothetical protein